jgi:hypothetical protein
MAVAMFVAVQGRQSLKPIGGGRAARSVHVMSAASVLDVSSALLA